MGWRCGTRLSPEPCFSLAGRTGVIFLHLWYLWIGILFSFSSSVHASGMLTSGHLVGRNTLTSSSSVFYLFRSWQAVKLSSCLGVLVFIMYSGHGLLVIPIFAFFFQAGDYGALCSRSPLSTHTTIATSDIRELCRKGKRKKVTEKEKRKGRKGKQEKVLSRHLPSRLSHGAQRANE